MNRGGCGKPFLFPSTFFKRRTGPAQALNEPMCKLNPARIDVQDDMHATCIEQTCGKPTDRDVCRAELEVWEGGGLLAPTWVITPELIEK